MLSKNRKMPSHRRIIRDAMGVVDELGDTLTSEQRRLLCLALQQEYDEDYEPSFVDSDSEVEEEEQQMVRVRTIINVTRPPILYVVLPIVMQALVSVSVIVLRQ